jgi:hypothetical protein
MDPLEIGNCAGGIGAVYAIGYNWLILFIMFCQYPQHGLQAAHGLL